MACSHGGARLQVSKALYGGPLCVRGALIGDDNHPARVALWPGDDRVYGPRSSRVRCLHVDPLVEGCGDRVYVTRPTDGIPSLKRQLCRARHRRRHVSAHLSYARPAAGLRPVGVLTRQGCDIVMLSDAFSRKRDAILGAATPGGVHALANADHDGVRVHYRLRALAASRAAAWVYWQPGRLVRHRLRR